MLEIEPIYGDVVDAYFDILGEDVSEDVNRQFYRAYGAISEDDSVMGAMVYELYNVDAENEDVKSRIKLLKADSEEAYEQLHNTYKDEGVCGEDITESYYWLEDEDSALSCEAAGFSKMTKENETVTLTLKEASEIPYVAKAKKLPDYIRSINDISREEFRLAVKDVLFSGRKGNVEDLGYLEMDWFENTVSSCVITDKKVSGLFLIREKPSGIIEPLLLVASGPDSNKHMAYMIAYSIKKGLEKYPMATEIEIVRMRKEITALVDKLFPGIKGKDVFYGNRNEA